MDDSGTWKQFPEEFTNRYSSLVASPVMVPGLNIPDDTLSENSFWTEYDRSYTYRVPDAFPMNKHTPIFWRLYAVSAVIRDADDKFGITPTELMKLITGMGELKSEKLHHARLRSNMQHTMKTGNQVSSVR